MQIIQDRYFGAHFCISDRAQFEHYCAFLPVIQQITYLPSYTVDSYHQTILFTEDMEIVIPETLGSDDVNCLRSLMQACAQKRIYFTYFDPVPLFRSSHHLVFLNFSHAQLEPAHTLVTNAFLYDKWLQKYYGVEATPSVSLMIMDFPNTELEWKSLVQKILHFTPQFMTVHFCLAVSTTDYDMCVQYLTQACISHQVTIIVQSKAEVDAQPSLFSSKSGLHWLQKMFDLNSTYCYYATHSLSASFTVQKNMIFARQWCPQSKFVYVQPQLRSSPTLFCESLVSCAAMKIMDQMKSVVSWEELKTCHDSEVILT